MSRRERGNPWRLSVSILFLLSCAPSQVSHMKLDLGVGYNISYKLIFWNQEKPETTRVVMAVHVTEVSDLDYSLTTVVTGDQEGTIILQVSPGGKTMEADVQGLPDPWSDLAAAGLVSPCVPLPQEPVSPGQSWEAVLSNGKALYTHRGTGLLEGKQGYILEFSLSTSGMRGIRATGKVSVSRENEVVQAATGNITTAFGAYGYRVVRE